MQLTQKETSLLKDMKDQEKLCVEKYKKHAEAAHDPQLKQLFTHISGIEQGHLDTLNQISTGVAPAVGGAKAASVPAFSATYTSAESPEKKQDCYLCTDLLTTEKHAAALYNTCVFEFGQTELREVLNRIQTDEQHHGEQIYKYMKVNGMYNG